MKKVLLFAAVAGLFGVSAQGQSLRPGYLTWPQSEELGTYIEQWNGGAGKIKVDGKEWEDQEFFTSRVKPRTRFTNTNTQVYPERLAYNKATKTGTDKRFCYWVCVSDQTTNAAKSGAHPNGLFDQEVFNMWSYIDTYGNWDSPFGWTPGVFADVAHKNGVGVSGVASVPFGGITSEWRSALEKFGDGDKANTLKFLTYFGQNGLGYNSEWSSYAPTKLIAMHNYLRQNTTDPTWEVMWYAGTNDNGSIAFDQGVGSTGGNTKLFEGASMFLNYNWNSTSLMNSSVTYAKSVGEDPFRIYAGMDMQGGQPKVGSTYTLVKDYQYGIGMWAGHNNNILWQNRLLYGSDLMTKQRTYNLVNQRYFGNGKLNPAIKQTIVDNRSHFPDENFAGMSAMMNARSVLDHKIATEPFYTYFNLGNGKFFNYKGERMNSNEWYNIGVQDYTPTWRYWFAPTWLQNTVTEGTTHLTADFTWEDAYFGGSCLKVEGSAAQEYLHLFKTNFTVGRNHVLTVRYKLLEGKGDIDLLIGPISGAEPTSSVFSLATVANSEEMQDVSYKKGADGWVTFTKKLTNNDIGELSQKVGTTTVYYAGVIGLKFKNAENVKLLLGEISLLPTSNTTTPAAPTIKLAKTLHNGFKGVDGKLIWTMDNDAALNAGVPCYNSDVKVSLFRTWAQQEGGEPVNIGATTSWAALLYQCPFDTKGSSKMRFGVSAVATDQRTESAISWSEYLDLPTYERNPDVTLDKPVIKPNEKFTMGFVDETMPSATWVLKDASQTDDSKAEVWRGTGKTVTCPGLTSVGAYNLTVTYDDSRATVTKEYPRYITITSIATGALPEIYTMAVDDNAVTEESPDINIKVGDPAMKFTYTGRYADGAASRGVSLDEKWFGVGNDQLGIQAGHSFTVACWIKYPELPDGNSNFLTIEDRVGGGWPYSNWGYFWSRVNGEGGFTGNIIDSAWGMRSTGTGTESNRLYYAYKEAKLDLGVWTHVAVVFDYENNNPARFRNHFYINGRKQKVSKWANCNKGALEAAVGANGDWSQLEKIYNHSGTTDYDDNETYEPRYTSKANWSMNNAYKIAFGGGAQNITATKGSIDDLQVWGKVVDQDDINASMYGLDKNNLPADVLGYWDFESEPDADYGFVGYTGANATKKSPKAYLWDVSSGYDYHKADYLSGCPIVPGSAYPIVTKPTWTTRGKIQSSAGDGVSGDATIEFPREADYEVALTLANGHGSTTANFPVVKVITPTAIDGVVVDESDIATYAINGTLFVDFTEGGDYTVEVYNVSGMLSAKEAMSVVGGQTACISIGAAGVYVVKVVKNGAVVRTVKIVNK